VITDIPAYYNWLDLELQKDGKYTPFGPDTKFMPFIKLTKNPPFPIIINPLELKKIKDESNLPYRQLTNYVACYNSGSLNYMLFPTLLYNSDNQSKPFLTMSGFIYYYGYGYQFTDKELAKYITGEKPAIQFYSEFNGQYSAGFEIENPRTKEIPGMEWIKDANTPTALDVRDDRINLFVDVKSSRQIYYYAVRAVSPGNYRMGPVSAEAMYNGEYHSYNGAGVIKVSKK
jgi:hypothetical protein